jgi:hypothetical protein
MNFVMPSTIDIPDRDEQALLNWLMGMMTAPSEPALPEVDDSTAEPRPDAHRSAPRRARWRGASTMTRAPAAS